MDIGYSHNVCYRAQSFLHFVFEETLQIFSNFLSVYNKVGSSLVLSFQLLEGAAKG